MRSLPTTALLLFGLLAELHAAPKLVLTPETYDFGEASSGEMIQASFTLRNKGDEPLIISRVRTSCGCTTTALEKRELAPGEETPLVATLSLKGRYGPQHKYLTITSNDPEHPTIKVQIKGTAIRYITLTPSALYLISTPQGKTITRSISITSEKKIPFRILSIETSHPDLGIEVESSSKSAYRVLVTLSNTWPAGRIDESLRIHTDHPKAPLLTCKIKGTLQTQETTHATTQ